MENKNKEDLINHPAHYANHKIVLEPIDILETMPFGIANIFKYIVRAKDKGSELQDLQKSVWYLERTRRTYSYERINELLAPLYIFRHSENIYLKTFGEFLIEGYRPAYALAKLNEILHSQIYLITLSEKNPPEKSNQNVDIKQDDNEEKDQDITN